MPVIFNGTTKKIPLSKVELKEFFKFYQDEICPYLFNYTLEDETELIVKFEERNFSHIIGLHKFERIKKYKNSERINEDILNEKINFKELRLNEMEILRKNEELGDRISFFPVFKTLLETASTVYKYNVNVAFNSKIQFSFLLKSEKIVVIIYLAVKRVFENKKICVPVSLLVDRNDKFSKLKMEEIKIKNLKMIYK